MLGNLRASVLGNPYAVWFHSRYRLESVEYELSVKSVYPRWPLTRFTLDRTRFIWPAEQRIYFQIFACWSRSYFRYCSAVDNPTWLPESSTFVSHSHCFLWDPRNVMSEMCKWTKISNGDVASTILISDVNLRLQPFDRNVLWTEVPINFVWRLRLIYVWGWTHLESLLGQHSDGQYTLPFCPSVVELAIVLSWFIVCIKWA